MGVLYYAHFFIQQQQQQQNDNVIPMPTLYNDSNESAPDGRGLNNPMPSMWLLTSCLEFILTVLKPVSDT